LGMTAQTRPTLRSPWDLHPVAVISGGVYSCPSLAALPKDIDATSFYSDDKHSVIDPKKFAAYNAAKASFEDTMHETEKAADDFQATGHRTAANCVLQILTTEAAAQSMTGAMSSNQAYYVQNWTLGALAVTWLKVRDAEPGTATQRKAVTDWMGVVADQTRTYFTERHDKNTKDGTNNHYYWAGFAVMVSAISTNDRSLYDWGKGTFEEAASRIAPDGTLQLEMDRGQRALHYHLFALAPIVMLAEFGEANGDDLYASHDHAVQRLVARTIDGLLNNSYFTVKAGVEQDTPGKEGVKSNDIAWLVPYLQRFPNNPESKVLHSIEIRPYDYLGGYPPGWKK